jgi:hypothetical protein
MFRILYLIVYIYRYMVTFEMIGSLFEYLSDFDGCLGICA